MSWDKHLSEVECTPATVDSFAEACIDAAMAECEQNYEHEHDYHCVDPGMQQCRICGDVAWCDSCPKVSTCPSSNCAPK